MTTCTWTDCTAEATTPQIAKDGTVWANLCDAHAKELDEAVQASRDPKKIPVLLCAWSNAQSAEHRERLARSITAGSLAVMRFLQQRASCKLQDDRKAEPCS